MAQCLRDRKCEGQRLKQSTINALWSYYNLARYYDYSEDEAKRVAVLSIEAEMQGGSRERPAQAMRVSQRSTHGGKETAETFDRLTAGRTVTEEVNLWYIDGVLVNKQIVTCPETQTIEQIETEPNSEVKRVRIERFGWPRYLRETKAKVIDVRDNDIDGTKESLMETRDKTRVLVCACPSTARVYTMRVPREIGTCEIAQRWLHGERNLRIIGAS